jgi:hypothetical protein
MVFCAFERFGSNAKNSNEAFRQIGLLSLLLFFGIEVD